MLSFFYRWRYRRAQKAGAYKVPPVRDGSNNGRVSLGNYMSQASVRGRTLDRFDLPLKRRKGLVVVVAILSALLIGWITIESISALELFRN